MELRNYENYEKEQIKVVRVKEIVGILWVTSKEDCESMIDGYKQYLKDIRKMGKLKDRLSKLTLYPNYFELKKQLQLGKALECPNCNANIYYDIEQQVLLSHEPFNNDFDRVELEAKIAIHEKNQLKFHTFTSSKNEIVESYDVFDIQDKNNIKTELTEISQYYKEHLALEQEKNNLVISNLSKPMQNKTELQ